MLLIRVMCTKAIRCSVTTNMKSLFFNHLFRSVFLPGAIFLAMFASACVNEAPVNTASNTAVANATTNSNAANTAETTTAANDKRL